MLSATGLISLIIYHFLNHSYSKIQRGYVLMSMLLGGIAITLLFQHAPRYGVLNINDIILDIRTYVSFLFIMLCLQQFFIQFKYQPVSNQS
jgi:urea transporter